MPGNDVNSFGTEEDDIAPTDKLGLDEVASEVETPPVESEEEIEYDVIGGYSGLPLGE